MNNTYFSQLEKLEHPRSRCRPIQLTEENPSFFGLQTAIFLLCPHVTEREIAHKLSGVSSCKGANAIMQALYL